MNRRDGVSRLSCNELAETLNEMRHMTRDELLHERSKCCRSDLWWSLKWPKLLSGATEVASAALGSSGAREQYMASEVPG